MFLISGTEVFVPMVVDAARPNNGTRTAGKALAPNTAVPHSPWKGMRHGKYGARAPEALRGKEMVT